MSDKIRVFDHITTFSNDTSFQEFYKDLTYIYNQGDTWTDISVDFPVDCIERCVITGWRLETDKEYEDRQKALEKAAEKARVNTERAKAANEKRDRKEYERLKKKYEGK
jgi:hypothetical protein